MQNILAQRAGAGAPPAAPQAPPMAPNAGMPMNNNLARPVMGGLQTAVRPQMAAQVPMQAQQPMQAQPQMQAQPVMQAQPPAQNFLRQRLGMTA